MPRRRRPAPLPRLLAALAALAAAAPPGARAQQPAVELDALRTPTSPAFVILDISPTAVERPTTPRAFALSLLSSSGGQAGVIPENYAAEFAPYWLGPRRRLTFDQYFRPTLAQRLRQTFSVSVATTELARGTDSLTAVGVGFRLAPLVGEPSDSLLRVVDALKRVQGQLLDLDIALDAAATAADSARILGQTATLEARARDLSQAVRDNDEPVGVHLQLAGALAGYYPRDRFDAGTLGRSGLWGTLGVRMNDPGVDMIALTRVLWEDDPGQTLWDVGGRAVLTLSRVAASLEFVARSASDAGGGGGAPALASGNRVVGLVEYRVSDDLFVNFSFGQSYPRAGQDGQPLVAVLGGQLNLGSRPLITPAP